MMLIYKTTWLVYIIHKLITKKKTNKQKTRTTVPLIILDQSVKRQSLSFNFYFCKMHWL